MGFAAGEAAGTAADFGSDGFAGAAGTSAASGNAARLWARSDAGAGRAGASVRPAVSTYTGATGNRLTANKATAASSNSPRNSGNRVRGTGAADRGTASAGAAGQRIFQGRPGAVDALGQQLRAGIAVRMQPLDQQTVMRAGRDQIIVRLQRQTAARIGTGMQTDLFQKRGGGRLLGRGGGGFAAGHADQAVHVRRQGRALQVAQPFRLIAQAQGLLQGGERAHQVSFFGVSPP